VRWLMRAVRSPKDREKVSIEREDGLSWHQVGAQLGLGATADSDGTPTVA
jgi:hypothetical protein